VVKTDGPLQARARRFAGALWFAAMALLAAMVAASFVVRPDFTANFVQYPWLLFAPAITAAAAVAIKYFQRRQDGGRAFVASATLIAGILASVAAGLYPRLLPAGPGSAHPGLDIFNAASPEGSLRTALAIYLWGLTLVALYQVTVYRLWRGKARGVYH
jgi:cytochrome bd ubiquinol oxidase subunit II